MKKKFESALREQVKDCGLSTTAVDALVEQGLAGIADDASDEQVTQQVNLFVNIAKLMQGETTRKVQAAKKDATPDPLKSNGDDKGDGNDDTKQNPQGLPADFLKGYKELSDQVKTLLEQNEKTTRENEVNARTALIVEAAKKAGLPESFAKLIAASHTDVKTEEEAQKVIAKYRQEWVNNNLRGKRADGGAGSPTDADKDKAEAEAFAKTLPDK